MLPLQTAAPLIDLRAEALPGNPTAAALKAAAPSRPGPSSPEQGPEFGGAPRFYPPRLCSAEPSPISASPSAPSFPGDAAARSPGGEELRFSLKMEQALGEGEGLSWWRRDGAGLGRKVPLLWKFSNAERLSRVEDGWRGYCSPCCGEARLPRGHIRQAREGREASGCLLCARNLLGLPH